MGYQEKKEMRPDNLKEIRNKFDLTQHEFAMLLNLSSGTVISRMEKSVRHNLNLNGFAKWFLEILWVLPAESVDIKHELASNGMLRTTYKILDVFFKSEKFVNRFYTRGYK